MKLCRAKIVNGPCSTGSPDITRHIPGHGIVTQIVNAGRVVSAAVDPGHLLSQAIEDPLDMMSIERLAVAPQSSVGKERRLVSLLGTSEITHPAILAKR